MNWMKGTRLGAAGIVATLCLVQGSTLAQDDLVQEDNSSTMSGIEELGNERYQIGEIIVDRNSSEFTLPGTILHLAEPLEYLAVSTGGMKEYESLLELTTSPREFNLACILIGLDDAKSTKPRYQFDEQEPEGQSVVITLSWQEGGETKSVSGANAMTAGEETFDDHSWVYIGSATSPDGQQFMAEFGGTLIGFVHDPYSVIEHKSGGGIGAYGMLTGDEKILPPEGTAISLTIALATK
jgi:hypothetical protein